MPGFDEIYPYLASETDEHIEFHFFADKLEGSIRTDFRQLPDSNLFVKGRISRRESGFSVYLSGLKGDCRFMTKSISKIDLDQSALGQSIERLYQVFAKYRTPSVIDGCPCCVSKSDEAALHSKALRYLDDTDISRYAFKAMTTWGSVADFKHYLPRILELLSTTDFIVDTFVVLGKLDYGKWRTWEANEIAAIEKFLLAWWIYKVQNASYFDDQVFVEMSRLLDNHRILLDSWDLDIASPGFARFVEFVHEEFRDIVSCKGPYKAWTTDAARDVRDWVAGNRYLLEEAFFAYEQKKPQFAEEISNALYIVEQLRITE